MGSAVWTGPAGPAAEEEAAPWPPLQVQASLSWCRTTPLSALAGALRGEFSLINKSYNSWF